MSGRQKPRVAFVCVHNSCRSQIAEALGKKLAGDRFDSYSAGTVRQEKINPDAVRLMKDQWGIDMEASQYSKLLSEIPEPQVVVLMGCNVVCPRVSSGHIENWGLEDPTGKGDEAFLATIQTIEQKIMDLRRRILSGEW